MEQERESKNGPINMWTDEFSKGAYAIYRGKGKSFEQIVLEKMDIIIGGNKNLNPYLLSYIKTNFSSSMIESLLFYQPIYQIKTVNSEK